jgi:hypothetical protein
MQAALGRLYDTIGIDIDPNDLVKLDAGLLVRKTNDIMASWDRGETGGGPAGPPPEQPAGSSQVPDPAATTVSANDKPGFFARLFGNQAAN